MAGEGEPVTPLELITFTSRSERVASGIIYDTIFGIPWRIYHYLLAGRRECYVYGIPPAPTSLGHRAELWNVNKVI